MGIVVKDNDTTRRRAAGSSTAPPMTTVAGPPTPSSLSSTSVAPARTPWMDGVPTNPNNGAAASSAAGGGASSNDINGDCFTREFIYQTNDSILTDYATLLSHCTDNKQYWNSQSSRLLIQRDRNNNSLPTNQIEVLLRRKAIIKMEDVENSSCFIQQHQQQQQQQQRINIPSSVLNIDTSHSNNIIPNKTTTLSTTTTTTTTKPTTTTPFTMNEDIIGDTSLGLKLTIIQGKVIIQHIVSLANGTTSPAQLLSCNSSSSNGSSSSSSSSSSNGSLLLPGDVIIGVNGKTLLSSPNGVISANSSMDKILSVLQPLSSPTNTVTKEYCRVVKLRIALGDGKVLLAQQEKRECRLAMEKERRQKLLGWDSSSGGGGGGGGNNNHDPVADLFGIGTFMSVDLQHGGLSMFGNVTNNDNVNIDKLSGSNVISKNNSSRVEPTTNMDETTTTDDSIIDKAGTTTTTTTTTMNDKVTSSGDRVEPTAVMYGTTTRPTLQSQIAYQTLLDVQYIRQRNTSKYYTLNSTISNALLRPPPLPPPESSSSQVFVNVVHDQYDGNNTNKSNSSSIDAHKLRIENGAQMITNAISYLSLVESQDLVEEDKGIDNSMVVVDKDGQSSSSSNHKDSRCSINDQQPQQQSLMELAATNEYWQSNIVQQLSASVLEDMNNEIKVSPGGGTNTTTTTTTTNNTRRLGRIDSCTATSTSSVVEEESALTIGFDTFLFGKAAVAGLTPRTQSLALPPKDVTSTLYDLLNEIECDLPCQIYMMNDSSSSSSPPEGIKKVVSFAATANEDDNFVNGGESNYDFNSNTNNIVIQATTFLLTTALGIWLRTFRPLQWKYRRVLWSTTNQYNTQGVLDGDHTTMISSRMSDDDDDTVMSLMSTSLMSGFTSKKTTTTKKKKKEKKTRDLRELIEDVALNKEIGGKMCRLVTFFFSRRLLLNNYTSRHSPEVKKEKEKEAIALIDTYGSYLDINKCLVVAGKTQLKVILDKLMELANYDPQHKIAMKALQNESTTLLLYEPSMFSALLEILPSMSVEQSSGVVDYMPLLVSAYPDLQPWYIRETLQLTACDFYQQYLAALLHYEDGNDVAKQDVELVKEWCTMLCSLDDENGLTDDHRQSFLHIATPNNQNGYCRDLLFLMDCSVKISEYELTFVIANEIITHPKHRHNKQVLIDVLQFLRIISDVAIESKTSMLKKTLLAQLIKVYDAILACMETNDCGFNLVSELSRLLDECSIEKRTKLQHDSSNRIRTCITTISETAPPTCTLRVLSKREYSSVEYFTLVSAIRTSLIRGARNGLRSAGLSGSLLQIQQVREDERRRRRRPTTECDIMTWKAKIENSVKDERESGSVIWASILNGNAIIAK